MKIDRTSESSRVYSRRNGHSPAASWQATTSCSQHVMMIFNVVMMRTERGAPVSHSLSQTRSSTALANVTHTGQLSKATRGTWHRVPAPNIHI